MCPGKFEWRARKLVPSGNRIVQAGISCPIGHKTYGEYNQLKKYFVEFVQTHLITAGKEASFIVHKQMAKSSFETSFDRNKVPY